jgi:hypothetical protein
MASDYLDWALDDFSGYVAVDELYDGPFCVLSAVDHRRSKRMLYEMLDHDPTHDPIRAFLERLKGALQQRERSMRCSTDVAKWTPPSRSFANCGTECGDSRRCVKR